jgi:hypothetical protein
VSIDTYELLASFMTVLVLPSSSRSDPMLVPRAHHQVTEPLAEA